MLSPFEMPTFVFIPCLLFWFAALWLLIICIVRGSIIIYKGLFPEENKYIYNEDTNEFAELIDGEIKILGRVETS